MINPLAALDGWLGKRIFQPPIIWVCQKFGPTQYAVARYCYMAAALSFVEMVGLPKHGLEWAVFAWICLVAVVEVVMAALRPDYVVPPNDGFRRILVCLALYDVVMAAITGVGDQRTGLGWKDLWLTCLLTAEYAKTIRTIPPALKREAKRSTASNYA